MSIFTTAIVFSILFYAILHSNHRLLFFFAILGFFADNFRIDIGPSLLLPQVIGFLMLPLLMKRNVFSDKVLFKYTSIFYLEFAYLIIIALIFVYIFPWVDKTGERLWTQTASGRSLVSMVRYINDFLILCYFFWLFKEKKVDLDSMVKLVAIVSIFSFWIGFADYFTGYKFKSTFFYVEQVLVDRFLGLNGEPKLLGRQGAVAYGIILYYFLNIRKNSFLLFAIITNVLAVFLSFSATGIVLFFAINIYLLRSRFSPLSFIVITFLLFCLFAALFQVEFFREVTLPKIESAIFGGERGYWAEPFVAGEPAFFARADIFDRLALVFLYENPIYLISGVGPNLISLPASDYIPPWVTFYEIGRVDSVPNLMIINVLARSGILGLAVFVFGLYRIGVYIDRSNCKEAKTIFVIGVLFSMIYFSSMLYAFIGLSLGLVSAKLKN